MPRAENVKFQPRKEGEVGGREFKTIEGQIVTEQRENRAAREYSRGIFSGFFFFTFLRMNVQCYQRESARLHQQERSARTT